MRRLRAALARPGAAWLALTALLVLPSLAAWALPSSLLDWQPARAVAEPWRAVSAAWVHWSPRHLGLNLLAAAAVAAFGHAAGVPARAALAWALAWPLTHAALAIRPELAHYGGLSGVLHAGVAVACTWLLVAARGRRRAVGAAVGAGLVVKLLGEAPWGDALQQVDGWDIAVAPLAHATGAAAGVLAAVWPGKPWTARPDDAGVTASPRAGP